MTGPNSCDLALNRSAMALARSTSATELDSCGSVVYKSAVPHWSAKEADCKSAGLSNCGCYCKKARDCCMWGRRTATLGRWGRKTAHQNVPTADDSRHCYGLLAPKSSLPGSNFQNQLADGLDRLHFPALPKCVCYCRRVASQCCPQASRNCDCSSSRADGYSTVPAAASSFRMTAEYCLHGHSLPVRCVRDCCQCDPESTRRY